MPSKPEFFPSASAFRAWLRRHQAESRELWVGFHKRGSGVPSLTWEEAVDAALCFGWIDGIRKGAGELRYAIRFTPRNPRSIWSVRNITRARELTKQGLMEAGGLRAFGRLKSDRSAVYSYEQRRNARLAPAQERLFRASKKAWEFFRAQAPSYQRVTSWWVVSAKKEETRLKRLEALIDASRHRRPIDAMVRPTDSGKKTRGSVPLTCPTARGKAPA
jgi:uncharacterized protein YdeI (YjbR/CyaY-like superfamily)